LPIECTVVWYKLGTGVVHVERSSAVGEQVMESSVSPKGQVTIPVEIWRLLGVRPRDKVAFRVEKGRVELRPVRSVLDELYQSVPALAEPRSWEEMKGIVREERAAAAVGEGLD
jgi:AbrB family looped-hinge helix DNA binding protein